MLCVLMDILSHRSAKKKTKQKLRVSNFALSWVVFKWLHGSDGVKRSIIRTLAPKTTSGGCVIKKNLQRYLKPQFSTLFITVIYSTIYNRDLQHYLQLQFTTLFTTVIYNTICNRNLQHFLQPQFTALFTTVIYSTICSHNLQHCLQRNLQHYLQQQFTALFTAQFIALFATPI